MAYGLWMDYGNIYTADMLGIQLRRRHARVGRISHLCLTSNRYPVACDRMGLWPYGPGGLVGLVGLVGLWLLWPCGRVTGLWHVVLYWPEPQGALRSFGLKKCWS